MGRKIGFYAGLCGIALFEVLNVYFIMPMPGSQRMASLDLAYALHGYRWLFRSVCAVAIVTGTKEAFRIKHKWLPAVSVALTVVIAWVLNYPMAADSTFKEPAALILEPRGESAVDENSVVVGVVRNGEAKAYPIRFLVYHHQVRDTVGGAPVLVTYCSVCRTGRVYEPVVDGHPETFRLVGMDHFNAMFEDKTTHSWWRQATGVAVAGPRKGSVLAEVESWQVTLKQWFELHPDAQVMQVDNASKANYDTQGRFERGESRGALTGTDPSSWQDKSWVIGVQVEGRSKAYDWNSLKERRVINDTIAGTPVVLALAADQASFAVFERPEGVDAFTIAGDVLSANGSSYDFAGREIGGSSGRLAVVQAHQEFWHSWRTFHPDTLH